MANLSQKTTDGRLSFVKYVADNPHYSEIEFELERGVNNEPLYDAKFKPTTRLYSAGTKFKIVDTKLYDPTGLKLAKVKIGATNGFFPIKLIRKPTTGNGTQYETQVVDAINAFIKKAGGVIDIKVGNKVYKNMKYAHQVDSRMKTLAGVKGDPKADIVISSLPADAFAAFTPSSAVYISHKKEGGPEAFQQYGGLSEQAGPAIYNHPEVQKFMQAVAAAIGKGNKLPYPMMMSVKDKVLINKSIYGPDYGSGSYSLQHVQMIGQGHPKFTQVSDGVWKLEFTSHTSLSGNISHFVGGYLPVFGATFRAGRGFTYKNKRYDGARLAIYPHKLMATRGGLQVVK